MVNLLNGFTYPDSSEKSTWDNLLQQIAEAIVDEPGTFVGLLNRHGYPIPTHRKMSNEEIGRGIIRLMDSEAFLEDIQNVLAFRDPFSGFLVTAIAMGVAITVGIVGNAIKKKAEKEKREYDLVNRIIAVEMEKQRISDERQRVAQARIQATKNTQVTLVVGILLISAILATNLILSKNAT